MWLELFLCMHLLCCDDKPDMLLLDSKEFELLLLLRFEYVLEQSFDRRFTLLFRNMDVNETGYTHFCPSKREKETKG